MREHVSIPMAIGGTPPASTLGQNLKITAATGSYSLSGHEVFFIPDREEFKKAASRITADASRYGGTEPAVVAWLLDFLQTEVSDLSASECEVKMWEVLRFSADAGQWRADYGQSGMYFQPPKTAKKKAATLMLLKRGAHEALRQYLLTGVADLPKGTGAFKLVRGRPEPLYGGYSLEAGFFYLMARLLARYTNRIRACKGCDTIILIGRKDQYYCSPSCRTMTFIRKQRAEAKARRLKQTQKKGGKHGKKR